MWILQLGRLFSNFSTTAQSSTSGISLLLLAHEGSGPFRQHNLFSASEITANATMKSSAKSTNIVKVLVACDHELPLLIRARSSVANASRRLGTETVFRTGVEELVRSVTMCRPPLMTLYAPYLSLVKVLRRIMSLRLRYTPLSLHTIHRRPQDVTKRPTHIPSEKSGLPNHIIPMKPWISLR